VSERHERFLDLAAARATGDLSPNEAAELARLSDAGVEPGVEDFERAAAAVQLAALEAGLEAPPADLRAALERDAEAWFALQEIPLPPPALRPVPTSVPRRASLGWWVAAAAAVVATVALWRGAVDPVVPLTAAERLARLEREADDLLELPWSPTGDELGAGVEGAVLWSPRRGEGFLRFRNLRANDPARDQYQLWIFDSTRPSETPVDGGVFDIPDTGEVIVPIEPKLAVDDATLFAVTLERPGGVVVSTRERLLLTAARAQ